MYSIDGNSKAFTFFFDRCSSLTYMILLKFAHPIKIERKNRSYEVGCKRNRYWPPRRWKFLEKKWLQFIRRMQGENVGRVFVSSCNRIAHISLGLGRKWNLRIALFIRSSETGKKILPNWNCSLDDTNTF